MRQKKVWRYYCDHCKKAGQRKDLILKHEIGCTRNPDRVCGMCKHRGAEQKPLALLTEALEAGGIDGLREEAACCPACMLAACMKVNGPGPYCPDEGPRFWFDFKAALADHWREMNESREGDYY